jgi:hypothetical protein
VAHSFRFTDYAGFILSEAQARDFVEMFYRWGDAKFNITTNEKERRWRGECRSDGFGGHTITLCRKNIVRDFNMKLSVGGNILAPTIECAAGMVLAHEIQHANQTKLHKFQEGFWKDHRYWNRACERDARLFVDEHANEICAYFSAPPPMRRGIGGGGDQGGEVLAVADLLCECEAVSMDDVRDELRASKVLNPVNVAAVIARLRESGIEVSR